MLCWKGIKWWISSVPQPNPVLGLANRCCYNEGHVIASVKLMVAWFRVPSLFVLIFISDVILVVISGI